jgi:hypothetical protein
VIPNRRKRIVTAYAALIPNSNQAEQAITFVNKTCRCRSLSHFLDTTKDSNVERLERILGI